MKFQGFAVDQAEGVILGHSIRAASLKKGHVIAAADVTALKAAGVREVFGARLEAGDVAEDIAAARIAQRLAGSGVSQSPARTGRCNLIAAADGIVEIDAAAINAINLVSEEITVATLPPKQAVRAGQIVATVKIIPFAVAGAVMARVDAGPGQRAVGLAPYRPQRFALISTLTAGLKPSVVASTEDITRSRIAEIHGTVLSSVHVRHETAEVAHRVRTALNVGAEFILIVGASATSDRNDVVPAGITAAGGTIDHFGMPVDPGNLLVLAHAGNVPILVLPGCARSPKLNGVDWVMQRLAAGLKVTSRDIMAMGVGGLLIDTPSRPLPRERAVAAPAPEKPKIAAIVLAAGQSRRMGPSNKLLKAVGDVPLVRRTVDAVKASDVSLVVVVTGHQEAAVCEALNGTGVVIVHNPRFAEGLSTSLKVGLDMLAPEIAGALICLADMPMVSAAHLDRLIAGFDPDNGCAIGVPTHAGKRGNPVLWARRFFQEMHEISGDVGARHLIGANESLVYEVEFEDTAVLTDLDTPEHWQDFLSSSKG